MVSMIMNSYKDDQNHLRQAIESCFNSEGVDIDLIISTVEGDEAIKTVKEFGIKKVIINQKPGIFEQLNAARALVEGDWFSLGSSNDIILPNKLTQEMSVALTENKKICYSAYYVTDEDLNIRHINSYYGYDYNKHLIGNFVYDSALMHRSIFDRYMPFVLKWKNQAIWDFWLRVYEGEGNVFSYNPKPLFKYRVTSNSQHVRRSKDEKWKQEGIRDKELMLNYHRNL